MRKATSTVTYALPLAFLDVYRTQLDTVDWANVPRLTLDIGQDVNPELEVVKDRRGIRVRAASAKSAVIIRRVADALEAQSPGKYAKPSADDVAAVLTLRNPKEAPTEEAAE